jgi:microcystin-dependent protein
MSYQVTFTETNNSSKQAITVADQSLNVQTDLTFVGKNFSGYGPYVAENFLHLLENFANVSPPSKPVQGQLWFDNSPSINQLKVYDGTNNGWVIAGGVKKSTTAPSKESSIAGDIWVDTTNQQLNIFSGSGWLLVGPQYSSGSKTGPINETVVDVNNISHSIISMYSADNRISIISKTTFTPKTTIIGFNTIKEGINLSSINSDNTITNTPSRFWGIAEKADSLVINGQTVNSSNFLRTDVTVPSNVQLSIRSDNGIKIGSDLLFSITTSSNSAMIKSSGKTIDFSVNNTASIVHMDATKVGIGTNNINPSEVLDVFGNITTSGALITNGTKDSTGYGIIVNSGGILVANNSTFSKDVTIQGKLYLSNLDNTGLPVNTSVILPSDTISYDIGSSIKKFRYVYANQFIGDLNGNITGTLTGDITGKAAQLASPTRFSMTGDVVNTNIVDFDGRSGPATFNTVISQDLITSKSRITTSIDTDDFLIYRSSVANIGLKKISKAAIFSNVATVPIGTILPYAGQAAPRGYLLCDGSEVLIRDYTDLYNLIGYTYKGVDALDGAGTFSLPDLRGRFALGRDNMDNNTTVPSKADPNILVDAGGGSANRVTDLSADVIGYNSGSENKSLVFNNIPDHKHDLKSDSPTKSQQYYAVGLPNAEYDDSDGVTPARGMPNSSTGNALSNSGGVLTPPNTSLGQPFSVMNPYLTINYIIFTGVL